METTEIMNNEEVMEAVEDTELTTVAEESPAETRTLSMGEMAAFTLVSYGVLRATEYVGKKLWTKAIVPAGKWVVGKARTAKENRKNKKQPITVVENDEDLVEVKD